MTGSVFEARIHEGAGALAILGDRLDDLHRAAATPITARRPWLEVWERCFPDRRPWIVALEDAAGELEAVAPLAKTRRGPFVEITMLGQGPSDYLRLPARTADAARALGRAVADALGELRRPWQLRLDRMPADDPVVEELTRLFPLHHRRPSDGAPCLSLRGDLRETLGRGILKNERQGWNRVRREGLAASIACLTRPGEIEGLLPELERIRRDRDVAARGRSNLADPRLARFWRAILLDLAARHLLEIMVLRLDDRVAAYTVSLVDGDARRAWDGRLDPRWARFSAGTLSDLAAVRRGAATGATTFDWMRGLEPYKTRTATELVPAETIVMWSSRFAQAAMGGSLAVGAVRRRLRASSALLRLRASSRTRPTR